MKPNIANIVSLLGCVVLMASCGGGGSTPTPVPTPTPTPTPIPTPTPTPTPSLPSNRLSADSPIAASCTAGAASGQFFANAEVEPFAAVHPSNTNILISAWQQDRWSNGGARALVTATSVDGGLSWRRTLMPFSRCGGAVSGSTGDYERTTDPWVDIGPTGIMYSMALSFNGAALQAGSSSALLASRSLDNGLTWSTPTTLLRDGESLFNDKNSLTADPTDARYVYAVWDRLDANNVGPTLLARSQDSGATWEAARIIYAPTIAGGVSQTIGNRIVVLADGTLINVFTNIDTVGSSTKAWQGIIRSTDKGLTWSAPIKIADARAIGATDPQTGKAIRDGASLPSIAAGPGKHLWVTWQDASFSNGARDAIALAHSSDGGLTWSAPVAINTRQNVAAFTPTIAVRGDGLVAVSYYDLRADTSDANTLLASSWLLTSYDGINWQETKIWGPFDMAQAPFAGGLFLGDYHGLLVLGNQFMPVLALSSSDVNNRTDIFALRITPGVSSVSARHQAQQVFATTPQAERAFQMAQQRAIVRGMEQRIPGWAKRVGLQEYSK